MYATYHCKFNEKLTCFVRPIFNSNDSVISNFFLINKKVNKLYRLNDIYIYIQLKKETPKLPARITFNNIST